LARVLAYVPDLLFGSNVLGTLQAAGHHVQLVADLECPEQLADVDVLVVDLTADAPARVQIVRSLPRLPTLAFYAHVESEVRSLAQEAGIELVVPRSRMAREGATLVERLVGGQ